MRLPLVFKRYAWWFALGALVASYGSVVAVQHGGKRSSGRVLGVLSTTTPETASADAPPAISAFVKSANELHPTTIYAGLRAYISVTVTDDKGIASAGFNAPGMKWSSADVSLSQCSGHVKSCSEPVSIIVPAQPGSYTVTVKATDSAGQTATQTLTFTAQACVADSECGGKYFPSSGATYCGPSGAAVYTQIMKSQVVSVCVAGSCDEKSEEGMLQDCGAGNVCTLSNTAVCVAQPAACAPNAAVTANCLCGAQTGKPGSYWEKYCCSGATSASAPYLSAEPCPSPTPAPSPSPSPSPLAATTSPALTPPPAAPTPTPPSTPPPAPISIAPPPPTAAPTPAPTIPPSLPPNQQVSTCPDGNIPSPDGQCLPKTAPIQQCLQAGGIWCPSTSPSNTTGHCAAAESKCAGREPTPSAIRPEPTTSGPEPSRAEERRAEMVTQEQFFAERRDILQDLRAMERLVQRGIVEVDAKLLKTFKDKLLSLKPEGAGDHSVLQNYRKQITELRGQAVPPDIRLPDDPRAEARALQQMQQAVRKFERYLAATETKIARVEKSGMTVDADIKETVATAKAMAQQVKTAKAYDAVRELAEDLPDVGQALNDVLPRLEELGRLPRVLQLVDARLAETARAIKQTEVFAKRLKLDVAEEMGQARTLLTEAKNAVAAVKTGGATDAIESVIQEVVLIPLDEILDLTARIRAVGSVRQAVNRAASDTRRYAARIRRLERAEEETQIARELLEKFKEQTTGLKELAAQKLTPTTGDQIIEHLRSMTDMQDELDQMLGLAQPDALETQIKKLFAVPGEKLKPFDVQHLEKGVW